MLARPKKPAPPFMECAARNTLSTSSLFVFVPSSSIANMSFSMSDKCSNDSSI